MVAHLPRERHRQQLREQQLQGQQQLRQRRLPRLVISRLLSSLLLAGWLAAGLHGERYDQKLPQELEGIGVQEHLGKPIDLNLEFMGENGYPVKLKEFFNQGKPVILDLVYYSCPRLCSLVLNGQLAAMKQVPWTAGKEFEVVTISINPQETFGMARDKKLAYLDEYGRQTTGWHFLADYQGNAKRLADQIGFRYRWDESNQQFIHSAAITILMPDGKIARYLYGIRFPSRDLRLGLTEASEYRLTNTVEKVILFCLHYDPEAKSYVVFARNLMKIGGALMVLAMGLLITRLLRTERRQRSAASFETKTVEP